jgi:tetrahydromethanopterin S-methyltransferase subunit A
LNGETKDFYIAFGKPTVTSNVGIKKILNRLVAVQNIQNLIIRRGVFQIKFLAKAQQYL